MFSRRLCAIVSLMESKVMAITEDEEMIGGWRYVVLKLGVARERIC